MRPVFPVKSRLGRACQQLPLTSQLTLSDTVYCNKLLNYINFNIYYIIRQKLIAFCVYFLNFESVSRIDPCHWIPCNRYMYPKNICICLHVYSFCIFCVSIHAIHSYYIHSSSYQLSAYTSSYIEIFSLLSTALCFQRFLRYNLR